MQQGNTITLVTLGNVVSNSCEPSCPFQAFNKYDCIVYPWKNEVETTQSFRLLSKANKVRQASLSRTVLQRIRVSFTARRSSVSYLLKKFSRIEKLPLINITH